MKETSKRVLKKQEVYLQTAKVIASMSLCSSDQVGAVIVNSYGRVAATGYNGPPKGYEHNNQSCSTWCERSLVSTDEKNPGYTDCPSIHAEANALLAARWEDKQGATLYVSSKPCHSCAKLIANSGVSSVIYRIT